MEYLQRSVETFGPALSADQLDQFARYQALLLALNEHMNLTGAKTEQEIQQRHFADSLTCLLVTGDLNQKSLIDVGSGAGFPGLPLKILYPGLHLTLLESVRKKALFLEAVVADLDLENVTVIVERAESLAHNYDHRERYDWAAARAVAHLSPLLEYLLPFCTLGGCALAQKGIRAAREIVEAQEALRLLGGEVVEQVSLILDGQEEANLIQVKKVRHTPQKYPRRAGMPVKRPL